MHRSPSPEIPAPGATAKSVLLTGAARRVGRATALELAQAGASLVLTYRRSRAECEATARDCVAEAARAGHAITADCEELDLADLGSVEAFLGRLHALLGRFDGRGAGDAVVLDAIVHNASDHRRAEFGSIRAADLEAAYRAEVVAPCLITQALAGALGRSALGGGGAVVLYSDVHALEKPRNGYTPYLVAKGAVECLAEQLAIELAPRVRVHCIAPGVVLWPEGFDEPAKERILERTPLGRTGTAEDAARLVRFLILEAPFMTGGTIRLDGGRALR